MLQSDAAKFHECKRYDGDGNLIETVSPDKLMATMTNVAETTRRKKKSCTYKALAITKEHVATQEAEGKSLRTKGPIHARKL